MAAVVYFSSASNNSARFVEHCAFEGAGIHTARIPLRAADEALHIDEPFVLICPTYGGGEAGKAVPVQVKRFLNDPANRQWIRGVIAAGNTNFGTAYAAAGPIIARKCPPPATRTSARPTPPPAPSSHANAMCRSCTASNSWAQAPTCAP